MTRLEQMIPAGWRERLQKAITTPSFRELDQRLRSERENYTVYPRVDEIFAALETTPPATIKAVILGQDPYHNHNQAHGLCFSVRKGIKIPPSLKNVFKELHSDLNVPIPNHGCLRAWAEQGILLLNTVLTVRAHQANSHRNLGWQEFTDQVIRAVSDRSKYVVFILWGNSARAKRKLIDETRHSVVCSPHPSPFSANRGFFGSRPFSKTNRLLEDNGISPVDWEIPGIEPEEKQLELGLDPH